MTMKWSPASVTDTMLQSIQVRQPSITGEPPGDTDHDTLANLSAPAVPNTREMLSCPAASTFTQNRPERSIRCQLWDLPPGQKSTSGGSSDSAAKAWHAKPTGPPDSTAVTTVTPVQKCPR